MKPQQYLKHVKEEMQRLAPITEEAWRKKRERVVDELAEMEDIEAQKE